MIRSPLDQDAFAQRVTEAVAQARRHRRPLTLLLLQRRHGDALLRCLGSEVASRLGHTIAHSATLFARTSDVSGRLDGVDAALLLPETAGMRAEDCARRLREGLSLQGISVDGAFLPVEVAVGGACFREKDEVPTFLERARKALAAAQRAPLPIAVG